MSVVRVFGTKGWLNQEKVRHIWLAALCGALAVMQASRFERLSFDPFPLLQNGFVASEVDVGGCDVVQPLMVALMVVVVVECLDLGFEITGQR